MKIFILIISDRHNDLEIRVFLNPDLAVNTARELAKEYCSEHPALYIEDGDCEQGCLFHAFYSTESDFVTVLERELHDGK